MKQTTTNKNKFIFGPNRKLKKKQIKKTNRNQAKQEDKQQTRWAKK